MSLLTNNNDTENKIMALRLRTPNYSLTRETQSGHYGESFKLHARSPRGKFSTFLGAGLRDDITVMRGQDSFTYVLSVSTGLEYAGLQVFDEYGERAGDCYFDDVNDLHPGFLDLTGFNQIKRLADYI